MDCSGEYRMKEADRTMTTSAVVLVLATFLASAVEAVEALTVVLAVGITRGWRSPLIGAAVATLALAAVIAFFGPALALIPLDVLRVVVGTLLLIFPVAAQSDLARHWLQGLAR
jgi:uncharacterized membrane protein